MQTNFGLDFVLFCFFKEILEKKFVLLADPEIFCYFLSMFACNTVKKKNVNNYLASKRSIPKHL